MVGVVGGEHHSMFWRQDGALYSVGSNASGQLAIRLVLVGVGIDIGIGVSVGVGVGINIGINIGIGSSIYLLILPSLPRTVGATPIKFQLIVSYLI